RLVGKTLAVVKAEPDDKVFGKVGTSAAEFEKALTGKKVVDARQQGKYFWLVMSSPPHPLFHFGMAGWWKIRNEETAYYRSAKPDEPTWPPKYWKFTLETAEEPKSEHAFIDFRRFSRIRLVDCAAEDMRKVSPLKENGPDPVLDKDVLTEEWLVRKLQSKHIPIKALLLDQANISGIGNWVGDELLLDAKIHPEQYSNTLTAAQMKQLHKSIHYVCSTAVELRAESDKFPETWLFKHRWGKGKKDDPQRLPNGERIKFLTVGGRTSAIIPSIQKKTGEVAADVNGTNGDEDEDDIKPKKAKKSAKKGKTEDDGETAPDNKPNKTPRSKKRAVKEEDDEAAASVEDQPPPSKKAKSKPKAEPNGTSNAHNNTKPTKASTRKRAQEASKGSAKADKSEEQDPETAETRPSAKGESSSGRRRSARVSNAAK
ncbi:MAG: hypothetical protein Q9181_001811, partial [Wetmoreana brouardii]